MPIPLMLGVPVTLYLRDRYTGREITIPTDMLTIEVRNNYDNGGNQLRNSEATLRSRDVTITADFERAFRVDRGEIEG